MALIVALPVRLAQYGLSDFDASNRLGVRRCEEESAHIQPSNKQQTRHSKPT